MNWIPEFLQPFGPIMVLLVAACLLALALVLHRVSNYVRQSRELTWLSDNIARKHLALKLGRATRDVPLVADLCDAIRANASDSTDTAFVQRYFSSQRRVDDWIDRGLSVLIAVAPMLGLAGTVVGMMLAFATFGHTHDVVTLRELGVPVSTALKTTLYGVCCAAVCATARRLCPIFHIHRGIDQLIEFAWQRLQPQLVVKATLPAAILRQPCRNHSPDPGDNHDGPDL